MKYSEKGDTITIEMSREDYHQLLFMLGASLGTDMWLEAALLDLNIDPL